MPTCVWSRRTEVVDLAGRLVDVEVEQAVHGGARELLAARRLVVGAHPHLFFWKQEKADGEYFRRTWEPLAHSLIKAYMPILLRVQVTQK